MLPSISYLYPVYT